VCVQISPATWGLVVQRFFRRTTHNMIHVYTVTDKRSLATAADLLST